MDDILGTIEDFTDIVRFDMMDEFVRFILRPRLVLPIRCILSFFHAGQIQSLKCRNCRIFELKRSYKKRPYKSLQF